jgi:ABC-type multidrug transport system fused ATPase/permease subunit
LVLPALLVSRLRAGVLAREGRLWSDSRAALSVETERFAEGLESHAGNGRLDAATARMGGGFEAHARHSRSWETAKAVFPPALEWFFFLALAALALLGASAGSSAGASAGVGGAAGLLPFGALLLLMYRPIREWARHYPVYLLGAQAWESVNRVRGELESFPIRGPRPASASGSLVLEGVGFGYHAGYPGRDGLHERQGRVIDGLDLEIEPSALTWITGRNGAGKSTLLKLLAGIESPREGRILLPGPWREPCFAYLPQKAFLDSDWRDWAQAYGEAHPGEWKTLDRILGLEPILARAGEDLQGLSGGERQRLCLARTLASPAPYLLLDEPTTWLAAGDRERILGDLLAFWRACGPAGFDRGGALVSHEPFIGEFCSRTVRMDRDPVGVRR